MNNIHNMLDLQMYVLENVYEDHNLFRKELKKSRKWLNLKDLMVLKKWATKKFYDKHDKSIYEILDDIPL